MNRATLFGRKRFTTPCTVEIEHSAEFLCAHVEMVADIPIWPGDQVIVQDAPTNVAFGQSARVSCHATIIRAGAIKRFLTRIAGYFELRELYEVSFSDRRRL